MVLSLILLDMCSLHYKTAAHNIGLNPEMGLGLPKLGGGVPGFGAEPLSLGLLIEDSNCIYLIYDPRDTHMQLAGL